MKIFISWSGKRSNVLAHALKEWLPDVLQGLDVWMSEHDIQAGARWSHALATSLEQCNVGIACLTKDNLMAPWLLFEAGAISKSVPDGKFIPLLLDLDPAEVKAPLSQFQLTTADLRGVHKVLESLNGSSANPLPGDRISRLLEKWWPDLEKKISAAKTLDVPIPAEPNRSDGDILREVLSLMRGMIQDKGNGESFKIWIDTKMIFKNEGGVDSLTVLGQSSISGFLDDVWYLIRKRRSIPAYTYGERWLLKNVRTGEIFTKIGRRYCQSMGEERDDRPITSLDIVAGDKLVLFVPVRIQKSVSK